MNIVNKYGQHLDDTTGRIVSLLIELQDKIPFSSHLEDITYNIEFFKSAVNKFVANTKFNTFHKFLVHYS